MRSARIGHRGIGHRASGIEGCSAMATVNNGSGRSRATGSTNALTLRTVQREGSSNNTKRAFVYFVACRRCLPASIA